MARINSRRLVRATLLLAGLVLAASSLGCGGKDSKDDSGSAPMAPVETGPTSGPGTVTVTSSTIRGQSGRVLLVFATQEGRGLLARACIRITSDSFAVNGSEMTDVPAGNDPCGGSSQATIFPEGKVTITAGIYAPPGQTPEKEVTQTVDVSGNTRVALDGSALSR